MDFHAEYFLEAAAFTGGPEPADFTLRIYVTRRPGTYGYQFAAVLWYGDISLATEKSGGCGYDKVNHVSAAIFSAFSAAMEKAGTPLSPAPEGRRDWREYVEGWGPERGILELFGRAPHVAAN